MVYSCETMIWAKKNRFMLGDVLWALRRLYSAMTQVTDATTKSRLARHSYSRRLSLLTDEQIQDIPTFSEDYNPWRMWIEELPTANKFGNRLSSVVVAEKLKAIYFGQACVRVLHIWKTHLHWVYAGLPRIIMPIWTFEHPVADPTITGSVSTTG